CLQSDNLPWTF
nr:immunoglobulin light chain junction region [Mus musculus]NSL97010.1 immunoglobulin light chain junction region [Mus musculus]NSL97555.1 immunoglobulin light chain junction region [Mus musculus]NSL98012.1 immunoglobulin light chain junction region [Mus musculus]NSL98902.1 immunoglobulin light chain junction region [Mus musculus]